jgi:hypothetical protein
MGLVFVTAPGSENAGLQASGAAIIDTTTTASPFSRKLPGTARSRNGVCFKCGSRTGFLPKRRERGSASTVANGP